MLRSAIVIENFFIQGEAGRIECPLTSVPDPLEPAAAAVVCHPHPLFGGTMHNKTVFAAAKTILDAGIPALRFNFRGAGLSDGDHDGGHREQDDLNLVIDHLAGRFPGLPLLVAGYSFGSFVGLRVGQARQDVAALIGIGVPVSLYDFGFMQACHKPVTFVQGERDQFGSLAALMALAAVVPSGARVLPVAGAAHNFVGQMDEVRDRVCQAIPREMFAAGPSRAN